jgi:TPR repeat protein
MRTVGVWGLLAVLIAIEPASADPPDLSSLMDTAAPKYNTPECRAAREKASAYDNHLMGNLVLGVALGLAFGPFAIPGQVGIEQNAERRDQDMANELFSACGDETFLPFMQTQAQLGDDSAQAWLGQAYARGLNGSKDFTLAAHWYELAAAQGNVAAEVNLGAMYYRGEGVAPDYLRAVKLWREASFHGSLEATTNLGTIYFDGKNYEEALKLFKEAAAGGHASAQFYLGQLYEQGLGVEKSDRAAFGWYSVAAGNGWPAAAKKRDDVAQRLSNDQRVVTLHDVDRCVRSHFGNCDF